MRRLAPHFLILQLHRRRGEESEKKGGEAASSSFILLGWKRGGEPVLSSREKEKGAHGGKGERKRERFPPTIISRERGGKGHDEKKRRK